MNTDDFKAVIGRLALGDHLDETMAGAAFDAIMSGSVSQPQIAAFLTGLAVRGETVTEITAGARALRSRAKAVSVTGDVLDTCGTGGDGKGTLNISTAVAVVLAGCGIKVAKHGNRAATSKSGSSEVLEALGVRLDIPVEQVAESIDTAGIGFMMAARHHEAMAHVAPVRKELGFRTIFNLLGPLANPAGAKRQLIGVFAKQWVEPLAHVLRNLGSEKVWVVFGSDGLDEMTVTGPSHVAELHRGAIRTFDVHPRDAGLPLHSLSDLLGGTPQENAAALKQVLAGETGAYRDIVLLNTAAALIVADKTDTLIEGVAMAADAIDSGKAEKALAALVKATGGTPP